MWRSLPGIIFAALVAVLLFSTYQKSTKPGGQELVGHTVPAIKTQAVEGFAPPPNDPALFRTHYVLVNFFASWCMPCRAEHPYLKQLANEYALPIVGIVWRDSPANITQMLRENGNPYKYVGIDLLDTSAYGFGVEGLPESFLIDAKGMIVATHRGPLTPSVIEEKFAPYLDGKKR